MHYAVGTPIIAVCAKADLIDESSDFVGASASGMVEMVNL
jgi:hypothetical protein